MNIELHLRNGKRKAHMDYALHFFAKELKIDSHHFQLDVHAVKGISRYHGWDGGVQIEENQTNKKQKVYTMFVDSALSPAKLTTVIAHEMVHIKQMVKGQYWYYTDDYGHITHFWLGKEVNEKYYDRPWEIEAWTKQNLLSLKLERIIHA